VTNRPTRADLLASYGRVIPDLVTDGLRVLLVGINPVALVRVVGLPLRQPEQPLWPVLHGAG
jgi:TDG/mug DNA glycosylase family protein